MPSLRRLFAKATTRVHSHLFSTAVFFIVGVTIVGTIGRAAARGAGQQPSARAIAQAIEARYHAARTLKAQFYERYSDGSGGVAAEAGTVYFSRPGRMRWEYEDPEKKLFLVDGNHVWFYVPADRTASRAKLKQSSDWRTPLALLVGKAKLSDLCHSIDLVEPGGKYARAAGFEPAAGDSVLRCVPRGESDTKGSAAQVVYLEADSQARLVRVVIHQPANAVTEFRFGDWKENIPIPEVKFHFQPPPGVSIVDQSELANQVY